VFFRAQLAYASRAMKRLMLLIPLAVVLAGCGGGGGGTNDPNQGHLGETAGVTGNKVTIILQDFTITPANIKLPKVGSYTFELHNEGAQVHNLEIEGNGLEKKGTDVNFGKTSSFTVDFAKAGEYEMYCPVDDHKGLGMTGTITVA
jgi:uncharacterized cupredoxin-like copper-binding protein